MQCAVAADCADNQACVDSQCRDACANDDDCAGDDVCDVGGSVCVQCLVDDDCAAGTLCTEQRCTLGCRDDRDCPDTQVCGPHDLCVDGCADDGGCPNGSFCNTSHVCALGCNADDDRCAGPQVCGPDDRCALDCSGNPDVCGPQQECSGGICVASDDPECTIDDDCGFFAPRCNASGVCVACLEQADCDFGGGFLTCLAADQQCHPTCGGGGGCFAGVCDDDSNLCVQCNVDDDCAQGQRCRSDHVCELVIPAVPLCADCDQADDVCGPGNLCVLRTITDGFNPVRETACGIDCSDDGVCPQGFACELVVRGGAAVGEQCVPASRAVDVQTCVAVRDAREDAVCVQDDDCGAGPVDDGACVDGVCSLPCAVDQDCFEGETCAPVIGGPTNACQ